MQIRNILWNSADISVVASERHDWKKKNPEKIQKTARKIYATLDVKYAPISRLKIAPIMPSLLSSHPPDPPHSE